MWPHTKDTIHFLSHTNKPCSFYTKTHPSIFHCLCYIFHGDVPFNHFMCTLHKDTNITSSFPLIPINSFADCIMILLAIRSFMDTTKSTHKETSSTNWRVKDPYSSCIPLTASWRREEENEASRTKVWQRKQLPTASYQHCRLFKQKGGTYLSRLASRAHQHCSYCYKLQSQVSTDETWPCYSVSKIWLVYFHFMRFLCRYWIHVSGISIIPNCCTTLYFKVM